MTERESPLARDRASVRRLLFVGLPVIAALCLCLATLVLWLMWQRVARYPNVTVAGALGGVRLTVTALGHCLTLDEHFITSDSARTVVDWHKRRGWAEFVPLVPQHRVGPLAAGQFYFVDGSSRGTVVFERRAYCLKLN